MRYSHNLGLLIRDILLEKKEAYVYEVLKECKARLNSYSGSYDTFRRYFYILRKLGLIEKVREEKVPKGNIPFEAVKIYYKIAKGKATHPAWADPVAYAYGREIGHRRHTPRFR